MSCQHDNPERKPNALIEGATILRCRHCRMLSIEGASEWVMGGDQAFEALKLLAAKTKQERAQTEAALTSPIEDPRWEQINPW